MRPAVRGVMHEGLGAESDVRFGSIADILQPHRLRDLKVVCIGQPTPFRRVSLPVRCWPLAPPAPPSWWPARSVGLPLRIMRQPF